MALMKFKIDVPAGKVLHSSDSLGFDIQMTRSIKAADTIAVLFVSGPAILAIEAADGTTQGSDGLAVGPSGGPMPSAETQGRYGIGTPSLWPGVGIGSARRSCVRGSIAGAGPGLSMMAAVGLASRSANSRHLM
jgi:hypothetical protein